jgi:pyruvate dehydrogenase E1 component alpha subunit
MKFTKKDYLKLYRNLVRSRTYDIMFARRLKQGKLTAFYHQAEGGEAPAVAQASFLRKDDYLYPHYRGHSVPHLLSKGIDPKTYLAEHCTKATGCSAGVGGIHPSYPEDGVFGFCGSVGMVLSLSVGSALAAKKNGKGQVCVVSVGDGATNRGLFHETLLFASNWKLPLIVVCENNGLAMFTSVKEVMPVDDIADLAKGYQIPAKVVDGQDVVAISREMVKAIERARKGEGATFIECKTERYNEHDIGTPDLVETHHRTKEEIAKLRERDPVQICEKQLLEKKYLTKKLIDEIKADAKSECDAAEKFTDESPLPTADILEGLLYEKQD